MIQNKFLISKSETSGLKKVKKLGRVCPNETSFGAEQPFFEILRFQNLNSVFRADLLQYPCVQEKPEY